MFGNKCLAYWIDHDLSDIAIYSEIDFFSSCFLFVPVYTDAGIDLTKPVIGMCSSGMSSCTLVLAGHLCGCPNAALYLVRNQS